MSFKMSGKIFLPPSRVVSQWKEEKVIKWLKKVHLDDCIPAFEVRHIDGSKLLELTEQKLFTYQDLKIKHRKQIAKCVQECKSQASNAKKIVGNIKHGHKQHCQQPPPNGAYESDDDFDDWDSDFDTDEEEEMEAPAELNNNIIKQPQLDVADKVTNAHQTLENSLHGKFIPKPPDQPVISKPINGNAGIRNIQSTIPRPPLKRPPSQPPPPPVPQASSHEEPQEEYEIPINMQSNSVSTSMNSLDNCTFPTKCVSNYPSTDSSVIETYEFIESPEENYERVDAPFPNVMEKPMLPPRIPLSGNSTPPPPLPQKPKKLHDTLPLQERPEGVRTFSRPKLPIKTEDDSHVQTSTSYPAIGSAFFNSLLGRKSSAPTISPKIAHLKDDASTISSDGRSSRSASPEKDGLVSVGSSTFLNIHSGSSEAKKYMSPPPLPPRIPSSDDTAQNMATRPLPPVPVPKVEEKVVIKQQEVHLYPWFHEIERQDAEQIVRSLNISGAFVVRPSKRAGKENPYSLTIWHEGKLFHLNIRQRPDNSFALGKEKPKEKTFSSVAELISYHQNEPIHLTSRGEVAGQTILTRYPDKS